MTSCDALIIGAGPAGSTIAYLLARAGWSVAIVEKRSFPRRKVCGEYVSATNAPLFESMGLGAAFREAAGPQIRRIGLFAKDASLSAAMPRIEGRPEGWGRALRRERLDTLLLERALSAGARSWQPYTAVELRSEGGQACCRIAGRNGERVLRAAVVVAAHGSWEPGALPAQQRPPAHRASDLLAFKAHFRNCDFAADLMPLLAFPGGYGGMVQADEGFATLSLCIRRDALRQARKGFLGRVAGEAVLGHVLSHCRSLPGVLRRSHLEGRWLSAGPVRPGVRAAYASDVFSVGNAAGEAHPIIAEGISMAMQSAGLLARHLIEGQDDARNEDGRLGIGAAYSAEWRRRFAPRIRAAALFAHLAMLDPCIDLLLPVFCARPGLLTLGGALSEKAKLESSTALRRRKLRLFNR